MRALMQLQAARGLRVRIGIRVASNELTENVINTVNVL